MVRPNALSAEDGLMVRTIKVLNSFSMVVAVNFVPHFLALLVQEVNHRIR